MLHVWQKTPTQKEMNDPIDILMAFNNFMNNVPPPEIQ